jgi:PAS domain S-box-containing protein
MEALHNIALQRKLKFWGIYMVYLVMGLGSIVFIGWVFDIEKIKCPIPHLTCMNPTTSFLFILLAISFLCLLQVKSSKKLRLPGYILAIFILIVALIRILTAFNLLHIPIDRIIFTKKLDAENEIISCRMAPNTAFCFLLIVISIIFLRFETRKKIMWSHIFSLVVISVALLSILGYLYRVQTFYDVLVYVPMAIHTALGFLLISLAVLFLSADKGLMIHLTSVYSGSVTARLMIPAAIVIPVFLGYIRLLGHWYGVFSTEFGVTILMLSIIIIFVWLIWNNSISLNKKDMQRREAEIKSDTNMQQLMESEEKFQKAFQLSAAGISITRISDGVYQNVNDAFVLMTGFTKNELIGHSSSELGMVVDLKRREEVLLELRKNGYVKNMEISVHHKSGKVLEVLSSIETIILKGEKFALNIIFDITERKKMEKQLEEVNKELESFSYSVSHDLRAPLRAINGYAELLEDKYTKALDETGKNFLKTIRDNAKKMGQLIDDLLSFSKLGEKIIDKTDLDMNSLVREVLTDLNKIMNHNAQIKVDKLSPARGDQALIRQVFINLISNGIKYSSKKAKPIVEITSVMNENEVIYVVKDNGEGFDMAYAHKLFGVFQRLHSESEFEGTGVGLAIVHRIINKHGGKIWAEGEVGIGATFKFTLPHSNKN